MQNIAVAACSVAAVFLTIHVVVIAVARRFSPRLCSMDISAQADLFLQVLWLMLCSPLPLLYVAAWPQLSGSAELRWQGRTPLSEAALLMQVGSTVYEQILFTYFGKSWVFSLHHGIVLWCYALGLYTGHLHFWGIWCGVVEFTNIPVCILKICLVLNLGRGSLLEAVNGGCLYLSYLSLRVLSLPLMLICLYLDCVNQPDATWRFALEGADAATRWLAITVPACTAAIWVLSCIWFVPIHKGMIKVLRGLDPIGGQDINKHLTMGPAKSNGTHHTKDQ